jgi:hypothetical protein
VGLLLTLLLAFLIEGWLRRVAYGERSGAKHGLLVALLALVVTIVLALVGGIVGVSFIDDLSGVTLPVPASVPSDIQGLGTILTLSGILALIFPFIGGAIGGAWGARTGHQRP